MTRTSRGPSATAELLVNFCCTSCTILVINKLFRCLRVPRNKHNHGSGRHCQVDEHLLSSHAYSDKYGGSTTLLRCASAVISDHKSSMLDEQYVIPLDDLCPYHQHVHLVAPQPVSMTHVEQTTGEDGAVDDDDYRTSSELEFPADRSVNASEALSAYDRLPTYGFTARTTATMTRNGRNSGNSRRSFVTFKPQTTTNIVPADSSGGARTAPTGSCASLDLLKPSRVSSSSAQTAESVVISQEDGRRNTNDVAVGCVSLTQSSAEVCNAV